MVASVNGIRPRPTNGTGQMNDPRDPIPGPYRFEVHASVIWVACLALLGVWLWGFSVLQDQAAESVCETTARTYSFNDGCQQ